MAPERMGWPAGLAVLLVLVSGCADSSDRTSGGQETGSEATGGATQSSLGEPETRSFRIGVDSPGISTLGIFTAVENLNNEGWDIEVVELAGAELLTQAVAAGDVVAARGSMPVTAAAIMQNAPLAITLAVKNEWTLYATDDVAECAGLDGKRLAIHSEGSIGTLMTRAWIADNCAETKPEYVTIPGSENRFAALLSDEIDASPLELADAIALEAERGDDFRRLTSFAETLPALQTTLVSNTTWTDDNPNAYAHFLAANVEAHRALNADDEFFRQQVEKYLPGIQTDSLDEIIEAYQDLEIFAPNGGIEKDTQQTSIDFYSENGQIPEGLTADQLYDRSLLDLALDEVGRE